MIINKHMEQTVEWYYASYGYDSETPKNYYIQYFTTREKFFKKKIQHCLNVSESFEFVNEVEDEYGIFITVHEFDNLMSSTFYSFFSENNSDVPRFFKKTKSVRRPINEFSLLKFNNYFMRGGARYKSVSVLLHTLWSLFSDIKRLKAASHKLLSSWKDFYMIFGNILFDQNYKAWSFTGAGEGLIFGNRQEPNYKNLLTNLDMESALFMNARKVLPMFSFYIYKVDKKIFKNTRGRSGKYTFIWKYVAPYKRFFLAMFWLFRELRVTDGRTIRDRLRSLLHTFMFDPKKSWAWRIKKFSHNYVYRNCRYTLAEHYRTVTK